MIKVMYYIGRLGSLCLLIGITITAILNFHFPQGSSSQLDLLADCPPEKPNCGDKPKPDKDKKDLISIDKSNDYNLNNTSRRYTDES